jgi:predicted Zn-dependent protease
MRAPGISLIIFWLFGLFTMTSLAAVKVIDQDRSELEEFKRIADEAWRMSASGDSIGAGKDIEYVIAVAEQQRDAGDMEGAREYFRRATIIAPLRLDARLAHARLCAEAHELDAARGAYKIIYAHAENDEMLEESARFLNITNIKKLEAFAAARDGAGEKLRICLVTVPGGQEWLAHEIGARLRELLRVNVYIERRDFVPPHPDRGGAAAVARDLRGKLPWHDLQFDALAAREGIVDKDAATDAQIIALARKHAREREGERVAGLLDKSIQFTVKHTSQWQANALIGRLAMSALPRMGPRTLYIALVPQDIFADKNNFMFGSAQMNGDYAVVSYHRFAAEYTGETPKRERLATRTYKQVLSSAGFMLGVPRSVDPLCARAYPASLDEHDAKGDKLCDDCRTGFAKALGHELGGSREAR